MRKNSSTTTLSIGFCILLLMTAFTSIGFAQSEEAPQQVYQITDIQVKSGMDVEFEHFIKSLIPTLKEMGIPQMSLAKTANFGVADKYMFLTPLQDPALMDAELARSQSDVPLWVVSLRSALQSMVDSTRSYMLIARPDLSVMWEEGYQWKLGIYLSIGVAPGREQEFEKAIKEVVTAIAKTNIKAALVGKIGLGGTLNEYSVTIFYDSFTDMLTNTPAMEKEMAAAKLTPMTGIVYYLNSEVIANIPELSIQPAAQ